MNLPYLGKNLDYKNLLYKYPLPEQLRGEESKPKTSGFHNIIDRRNDTDPSLPLQKRPELFQKSHIILSE